MIGFLKEWITSIITFTICTIFLEILMPSGNMKKIVNLMLGIIFILVFINPFVKLIYKKDEFKILEKCYANYVETNTNSIKNNLKDDTTEHIRLLNEQRDKKIIELYKAKIAERIQLAIQEFDGVYYISSDICVDEDQLNGRFGTIKSISLSVGVCKENINKKSEDVGNIQNKSEDNIGNSINNTTRMCKNSNVSEYTRVRISPIKKVQLGSEKTPAGDKNLYIDEKLQKGIKEKISSVLGVDVKNITIK